MELLLRKWGFRMLLAFAFLYYGYYCRVWPGPGGEGGVDALVALRLLQGQRPIVDTFLGYNVLWFYPLVGLFKVFGPSYIAMRLFFFVLCTVTGLISFRLVLKCTGRAWPAVLAGLLVLVVPGQTYRNYMAFLVVLNMTAFLSAYVLDARSAARRLLWMGSCGVTLGIAYLVRVDVGYFLSFILLGLIIVFPLGKHGGDSCARRASLSFAGFILALSGLFLTHLPVFLDASKRGFGTQFVAQYEQWPSSIRGYALQTARATREAFAQFLKEQQHAGQPSRSTPESVASTGGIPAEKEALQPQRSTTPPKPAVSAIKITNGAQKRRWVTEGQARDKMLAWNLHLPVLLSLLLALGGGTAWIVSMHRDDRQGQGHALAVLTCLGCSLVLFPQYFFWQPNMVHLSEFMVPMTLTLVISCVLAASAWRRAGRLFRVTAALYVPLALLSLVLYYINACQSGGSGGIAVSLNKRVEFRAENGVCVKMTPDEFEDADAIRKIIAAVSAPGEFVICYPYHPEINFMTDRPSFEYNTYVDNDVPSDRFYNETTRKTERFQPVVFVINNWDINGTEESRFSNWAATTYRFIVEHYVRAYRHGNFEVFVRPDRADRIPPF